MPGHFLRQYAARLIFISAVLVALVFALRTNHTWEDYYITYRSSRNLATGRGLVYNVGDRLHTYTSPLGVLLPALAFRLTNNTSDPGALWIFRGMSAAAFGGGLALLFLSIRGRHRNWWIGGGLAGALALDPKSVDFTINGMETGFMLLFLGYAIWSHLQGGRWRWLHLGLAWAGLMWTRPDSFIYVGLLAAGFWVFHRSEETGSGRRELFFSCLRAALVTTALYLPWLVWAKWYYGSPVPHTVMAKSGLMPVHSLPGLLRAALLLPYSAWTGSSSLEMAFLPSYYMIGGWPHGLVLAARLLATVCSLLWLLPFLRSWSRAASFAFFGAHVYLTYYPYFPFPWYLPSTTLLGLTALAGLLDWLAGGPDASRLRRFAAVLLAATLLAGNAWMLAQVARQVRAQQELVEDGTRRKIGEWLREHAASTDTVFMEPLGYIGFYSGLKTYDWPGMSSREMVAARKQVGNGWSTILLSLQPTWVVLRPFEAERMQQLAPGLLDKTYVPVRDFNHSAEVLALDVHGRPYLEHDSHFTIYRLTKPEQMVLGLLHDDFRRVPVSLNLPDALYLAPYNLHLVTVVGTPAEAEFNTAPDMAELTGGLGVLDEDWFDGAKAGPVEFAVTLRRPDRTEQLLYQRRIDPAPNPEDRGVRSFRIVLPQPLTGTLRFTTRALKPATPRTHAFWCDLAALPLRSGLQFLGHPVPPSPDSRAQFGYTNTEDDGKACLLAHAPTELVYDWQPGMSRLETEYGIIHTAYTEGRTTEGVVFVVELQNAAGQRTELFRRHLDPVHNTADRGEQSLALALPPTPNGRVILSTRPPPSGHINNAWSFWRNLRAVAPPSGKPGN